MEVSTLSIHDIPELQASLNRLLNERLGFFASLVGVQHDHTSLLELSKVILKLILEDRILPLIYLMLKAEFEKSSVQTGTTLRENNLTSRLITLFTKQVGKGFVKQVLGSIVRRLVIDNPLEVELDESRFPQESKESTKKRLDDGVKTLGAVCEEILGAIVSPQTVEAMPRQIRAIAGFTSALSMDRQPSAVPQLIGSYLILRYLNPALISPESHDLLPLGYEPSPSVRRSLILVSKVIQNLSNAMPFGGKEAYMMPMNSFIDQNKGKLQEFLFSVATDPTGREDPFSDFKLVPNSLDKPIPSTDIEELVLLHRVFYLNRESVESSLKKYGVEVKLQALFFGIINELGTPKDANLKITIDELRAERELRSLMQSLRRYSVEVLQSLELIPDPTKKNLKTKRTVSKETFISKKCEDQEEREIRAHQLQVLLDITDKLCHPKCGVPTKEQEKAAEAKDIVDWLSFNLRLPERGVAVELAKTLLNASILSSYKSKNKSKSFVDDDTLYCFPEDKREQLKGELAHFRKSVLREVSLKSKVDLAGVDPERASNNLTSQDWHLLRSTSRVIEYKKDDEIVSEGVPNRTLYQIKSGFANVFKTIKGERKLLSRIGPETMICEMSVLDKDNLTSAAIVADTPTVQVWAIDIGFILDLFKMEHGLSKRFYKYMAVTLAKRLADKKKGDQSGGHQQQQKSGETEPPAVPSSDDPAEDNNRIIKKYECFMGKKIGDLTIFPDRFEFYKTKKSKKKEDVKDIRDRELMFFESIISVQKQDNNCIAITNKQQKKIAFVMKSKEEFEEVSFLFTHMWKGTRNKLTMNTTKRPLVSTAPAALTPLPNEELTPEDWDTILRSSRKRLYKKDEPIMLMGQYSPSIYKIMSGYCRVEIGEQSLPLPLNQAARTNSSPSLSLVGSPSSQLTLSNGSSGLESSMGTFGSSMLNSSFMASQWIACEKHGNDKLIPEKAIIGDRGGILEKPERSNSGGLSSSSSMFPGSMKPGLTTQNSRVDIIDYSMDSERKTRVVATLNQGDIFGEISFLLDGGIATASVIPDSESAELRVMDESCLNVLFIRQPALAGRFYRYLAVLLSNRLKEREKSMADNSETKNS